MRVVGDTNVFRKLHHGETTLDQFLQNGDTLCYSPLTVLELLSDLNAQNFASKRGGAEQILATGANQLLDPVYELTQIFGFAFAEEPYDWSEPLKLLASASTVNELFSGQIKGNHIYRVDIGAVGELKAGAEIWLQDRISGLEESIGNFKRWFEIQRSKKRPCLSGDKKENFVNYLESLDWYAAELCQLLSEARLMAKDNGKEAISTGLANRFSKAVDILRPYIEIRTQYVRELYIDGLMPQMNDMVDLELFVYACTEDTVIATAEGRWHKLCARANLQNLVRNVNNEG